MSRIKGIAMKYARHGGFGRGVSSFIGCCEIILPTRTHTWTATPTGTAATDEHRRRTQPISVISADCGQMTGNPQAIPGVE
jgi:hypothetical protein